ncbi:hypothetical protein [Paenibacillus sp. GP183]|jgi:FtsZ-interacting cell division protein ZipA|uniref:hypothetical protein n=1 Tax=Paenibacillus sp. GP183 TaxID=1882751 RepID=UPI00089C8F8D|nr:hypothetical protein [Paenibacillus sp. GP183]SEC10788.1 hypothetical protein SAMN05443246_2996 [Paenibacillus sp. GP183]
MTKKIVVTISIVFLLGVGLWYVKNIVNDKIYSKLSELIVSPEVQKEIEAAANSETAAKILQDPSLTVPTDVQNLTKNLQQQTGSADPKQEKEASPNSSDTSAEGTSSVQNKQKSEVATAPITAPLPNTTTPVIKNRSEAVQYALKKFSAQEITHYSSLYKDRNNLTPEQKQQIKAEVLSRFTPIELKALLAAANH